MKKLFFMSVVALALVSCSVGDDTIESYPEFMPIESVDIPEEFIFGRTYEMHVKYYRPSNCYVFNNFYYAGELNQRTVAVINTVYPNNNCEDLVDDLVDVSFNFLVTSRETYVFRFWQGEDDNGNDTYYIVEVPVAD